MVYCMYVLPRGKSWKKRSPRGCFCSLFGNVEMNDCVSGVRYIVRLQHCAECVPVIVVMKIKPLFRVCTCECLMKLSLLRTQTVCKQTPVKDDDILVLICKLCALIVVESEST